MSFKKIEKIVSITPLPYDKIRFQPVSINKDFVTIGCFKFVEIKKETLNGKKVKKETIQDSYPLALMWDGKRMRWSIGEKGQEINLNDKCYVLDRNVGEGVPMPDEGLVGELMEDDMVKKIIRNFKAKDLFNEIHDYFERYFYLEKDYLYFLMTLYVANIWVFDAHDSTPYLFIRSPMRGCGKTYMGTSIANMCNGEMIATPNAVHIFRMSHDTKTPMVLDEIKKLTSEPDKLTQDDKDILSLINTGFQKYGCKVPRAAETSIGGRKGYKIEMYESYTPKTLITTDGVLPHDTLSRCIDLRMQMASPSGPNYDERWNEPERLERLQKIRRMGVIFRLKYGMEIYNISKDIKHRRKLDKEGLFDGIHGRNLEIFRPLIILTLKYIPEWKEHLNRYIRKYIKMKAETEPSQVHLVLMALREIYKEVSLNHFKCIETEKHGEILIDEDKIYGTVLIVPIQHITQTIEYMTAIGIFGNKPDKVIGRKLDELGFVSGSKIDGKVKGSVRTIKITQLEDMCERYLGTGLHGGGDVILSQVDRNKLIIDILIKHKDGIEMDEIIEEIDGRMTVEHAESTIKHFFDKGKIIKKGELYEWNGG